ncbi:twin-arginine translocation signal domain-containing protein [Jatrophihabitans sp.]|uniref:twin-arginine translocation signal domain-containing protein n=1 Tax=Jatrophihabitans sp. TaxID=1932789 RepID=UPI002C33B7CD|nr:twin-arginine translocation signal domain-containing protein [Jatrophihabitans sp.]
MTASLAERIVNRLAVHADRPRTSRRGFLGGATLVGAALVVSPWRYLTRPASAYDAVCGAHNTCAEGYTVFCCTINGGNNSCPPDSFIGGWWKADNSSFCGGNARYYIDCNAYRDGRYTCHCNTTTCDQRRVACNQFRYGQCNTQIPWSQTGPVLCRVVSCTPPWVQYGGTCSSSSATDNNTATHSAPCLTGKVPVGVVEEISASGNTVHIKGWAYDPDSPGTSISVAIYQDGKGLMGIHASLPRSDVNSSRHITGNHGFEVRFTASSGQHNFTVFAMNIKGGSGNPRIGSKTITVNAGTAPLGHLDSCNPVGDSVVLTGWAFDRDAPSTSIAVNIYQDNKPLMGIHTGVLRSDVNSAYHISGTHGFKVQFKATTGAHNYKVWAMNVGGGTGNTLIGNHSLIVRGAGTTAAPAAAVAPAGIRTAELTVDPAGNAVGELESVSAAGTSVRLVGWLPDTGGEPAVAVHEDDQVLHWYPVPGPSRAGRRGFDITVPAGTGLHTYSVYALAPNSTAGTDATDLPLIGQRTVRVNQSGAVGVLERVQRIGDTVRLTGWASDPDRPGRRLALTVFRDGVALSRHQTDFSPDRDGGFDISIADLPGVHTYTVYAAPSDPGAPPTLIGARTLAESEDEADDPQVVSV